jgi:AI-2 transport protein TqsA
MNEKDYSKGIFYILLSIIIIAFFAIIKVIGTVVLPIIFACLLSFVFLPIIRKLNNKFKLPWVLCTIIVTLACVCLIFAISTLLVTSLSTIFAEYPKYESKFMTIYKIFADKFDLSFESDKSFFQNIWKYLRIRDYVQKAALYLSSGIISFGRGLLITMLMFVFLLSEMRFTNIKINSAFEGSTKNKVLRISSNIISEVVRFISIKFNISLATGILVGFVSWILKVDFPIVWGFIAFIMNFIPTFGSIISWLLTTLFALIQFYPTSIYKVVLIAIFVLLINFILGNILEPRIEGKHLGLSPFFILVSLTLWGWILGFAGMILAVPMTVIIKIVCENISFLHPFAIIVGNSVDKNK